MIGLTRLIDDFLNDYNIYEIEISSKIRKIVLSFMVITVLLISTNQLVNQLKKPYLLEEFCPEKAANFLIDNYDLGEIRLYNSFNTGAYLGFRGIKTFIDSRTSVTEEIMEDCIEMNTMTVYYNDILDKYKITHVLICDKPLMIYMCKDEKWSIVYQDEMYCIFERKGWDSYKYDN